MYTFLSKLRLISVCPCPTAYLEYVNRHLRVTMSKTQLPNLPLASFRFSFSTKDTTIKLFDKEHTLTYNYFFYLSLISAAIWTSVDTKNMPTSSPHFCPSPLLPLLYKITVTSLPNQQQLLRFLAFL